MEGVAQRSGAPSVRALETHISWLFLVGDRAYKLKKPVRLDFLDFTTRAAREVACHREVELNRRLAPDVYLGVADVSGPDGALCDHLVVMKRMPDGRRLSSLVERGVDVDDGLRALARLIASFHAGAATSAEISSAATVDAVRANWESGFETLAPFVGSILDARVAERSETLVRRFLAGRAPLFEARIEHGKIRDGHGDLLADDIYLLDDGPRVLDCIEFSDALRYGDVLADVAFLAMDLERLGAPERAWRFLEWYREFADERAPETLVEHYLAYRAQVRAKVACLRYAQGHEASAPTADALLQLSARHLERTRVALVLVGGLPGTGKSTVAEALADHVAGSVVRSDEVRKDLVGLGHAERAGAEYDGGIYAPEITTRTYEEMLRRARTLLEQGASVVLDASWSNARARADATRLARSTASDLHQLCCTAPAAVAEARIERRASGGNDASDATVEVARRMAPAFDPWPDAAVIDSGASPGETRAAAVHAIDAGTASASASAASPFIERGDQR